MTTKNDTTKTCRKCGIKKQVSDFYIQRRVCKQCKIARSVTVKRIWAQRPENKERRKVYDRQYRHRPENKKRKSELSRQRPKSENYIIKDAIYRQNRKARKSSLPNTLTHVQWQHALNYFNGCCAVCGRQMNDMFGEFTAAMDHWIPLSYKGDDNPGTVAGNIVPLCHGVGGCNNSKHATNPEAWLKREFSTRKASQIMRRIQDYFNSIQ